VSKERYRIEETIGTGGMGVVHRAVDLDRGASVALKTLKTLDPEGLVRLKREFRALTDVVHPNLVSLYELVQADDMAFFTMELVEGCDFLSWVRPGEERLRAPAVNTASTARLDVARLVSVDTLDTLSGGPRVVHGDSGPLDRLRLRPALRQVAEGVSALHQAGIIHRDIKPSNVMVTPEGRVVILDFGVIAQLAATDDGEAARLVGTPAYMPPEFGTDQTVTGAADWYSVGVMLFRALTGAYPFPEGRVHDVLLNKRSRPAPAPSDIAGDIPDDLDQLCVALLRADPARRPGDAEVLRRLGARARTPRAIPVLGTTSTGEPPLVGRGQALERLGHAFDQLHRGRPQLVRVTGRSGLGKTALTRAFLEQLRGVGDAVVLRGRCYERESVAYKAFDSLVDDLGRHLATLPSVDVEGLMPRDALALARVFPVLRQVDAFRSERRRPLDTQEPHELRRRAFGALKDLLARLADRAALVLAIDDAQWGDSDSALLLRELLFEADAPTALFLLCHRIEDQADSELLSSLAEDQRGAADETVVEVGPLDRDHSRELALAHLGSLPGAAAIAGRIADEAGGSPLLIEELSRYARDVVGTELDGDISLADVNRRRLRRLPEPAHRLIEVIAVAGRPIAQHLALKAAGVDDPAALDILRAGSFVRTRSSALAPQVECFHDQVREAVLDDLAPPVLRERHRQVAVTLERSERPDSEALAIHFREAGDAAQATHYSLAAARAASRALAFDRAVQMYRFALDLGDAFLDDRPQVLIEYGEALASAGRGADAARAFLTAAENAPPGRSADLSRRASLHLFRSGHIDEGLETITGVLSSLGVSSPGGSAASLPALLWARLRLKLRGLRFVERPEEEVPGELLRRTDAVFAVAEGLSAVDPIRASEFQARHLRLALNTGELSRIGRSLAGEAGFTSLSGAGAQQRTARILDRLADIVERTGDEYLRAYHHGVTGIAVLQAGRFREAAHELDTAQKIFRERCHGASWEISTCRLFLVFTLYMLGELPRMHEHFHEAIRDARALGDLYGGTTLRGAFGFPVYLRGDSIDEAYWQVDDAMSLWSVDQFSLQHCNALAARVQIDLYAGAPDRAAERIEAEWRSLRRSLLLRTVAIRVVVGSLRGRVALAQAAASDDPARLKRLLRRADATARALQREDARYARTIGLAVAAGVASARGKRDAAIAMLERAADEFDAVDMKLWAACARRAIGTLRPGADGERLVQDSEDRLRRAGVARPDRWARMCLQGFA